MRKIKTQVEIDKMTKRNQILIGGTMIALLVFSIVGYSFASGDKNDDVSDVNEMGIDFFRQNGLWVAEIDGTVFAFQNLPSEVSDIDVNVSIGLSQYSGQPLYFVNPNEGVSEVLSNLGQYILRYQEACLDNVTCVGDLPIKGCENNLIIFKDGDTGNVYQNGNCVFVVGDSLKATDAFLYKVLQVI
jgi:hypothetical protein